MKNAKLMFLATALTSSIILLGACSKQQDKQTSQSSSSSQTVQTSKSDSKSEAKAVPSASLKMKQSLTRKTQPLQQRVSMSMLWQQEIFRL